MFYKNLNKMLTIFSCPKPFRGKIEIIQRNAIKSWTLLNPRPEIILIGNEEGTAEICKEFGLRHIPEVERNEYGTPLVKSIFEIGQKTASNPLVCYVNADIILLSDFIKAIQKVRQFFTKENFFIAGRRWNIKVNENLDFNLPDWRSKLKNFVLSNGILGSHGAIDYFVFPKKSLLNIPPLAIGRCNWDNWLIYRAIVLGLSVIDCSFQIMAIHQNHNYSHTPFNKKALNSVISGPEVKRNQKLVGKGRFYTLLDANYVFTPSGIKKPSFKRKIQKNLLKFKIFSWYILTDRLYPFSYPVVFFVKGIKFFISKFK